jgi:tetratricopeptide (TPR) repeat protein
MNMWKFTMPTAKQAWCWVCVAALVGGGSSRAWAQAPAAPSNVREADMQRAERFAARGFGAYREKDYATAVALYLQAYDAAPSADMLFNIARIYDGGLSDRELAIRYYREYIAAPDAEPARIALASERVARLSVAEEAAVAPAGAAPAVAPDPPTPASPGPAPAHGGVSLVPPRPPALTARELDASSFATVPVTATAAAWTPLRVGAIVAGTMGLVGIGLGAGFGVAALSDASTARESCDGNICSSQRGVNAARSASESANIATVSFALGGTLLAAGVALLWLDRGDTSVRESDARVEWSPLASSSELGVACSGRW